MLAIFDILGILAVFLAGVVFGLIPGMHMNTLSMLSKKFPFTQSFIAYGLCMAYVAHSAVSFIPSIFLAAPSEETALSVLPGHKMFLSGNGRKALLLSLYGMVLGTLIFIVLAYPVYVFLPKASGILKEKMGIILVLFVLYMILSEKKLEGKLAASLIFLLSGTLGLLVLGMSLREEEGKLFCLLTGAYGLSSLVLSMIEKPAIPEQKELAEQVEPKSLLLPSLSGCIAGIFVGVIPAITSSQAAYLVSSFLMDGGISESFIVSIGAVNVSGFLFSLITLATLGKARNGTAQAVSSLIEVDKASMVLLIGASLLAVFFSVMLVLAVSETFLKVFKKLDYMLLNKIVFLFLLALSFYNIPGFDYNLPGLGLLISLTACAIGLLCPLAGVKRTHAMGMLLLPTILFYVGL